MKMGAAGATAHPDLVAARRLVGDAGIAPPQNREVHAVRAYLARLTAFTGRDSRPLAEERLLGMAVNGRDVPCRLYWPDGGVAPPLMFYCHGGGFRHGELDGWDAPLRQLVRGSGAAILSIGYALSPEHKFPVAFDQVVAIARRVIADGGIDGRPVGGFAGGGDSAGANLMLGAAVALRDAGIDALRHLMLLYGVYSKDLARPSWQRLGGYDGHGLSAESMGTYWAGYLAQDEDDWRAQPLHADLAGMPPSRITVGELDPLVDENAVLAAKLRAAGVPVTLTILPGIVHGVMRFNEVAPVVRDLLETEGAALRRAFD